MNIRKNKLKHLLAHVVLIIASCCSLFPIWWIFTSSIRKSNTMFTSTLELFPKKITFDHYINIFTQGDFLRWMGNSFFVAGVTTVLSIAMGILGGYAFSRFNFKGKKLGMSMLLMLNAFPNVLAMVALYRLFSALGLLDRPMGLVIIYTSWQLIFAVWNIKGYIDSVPKEIEEAAKVDGAGNWCMLTKIILPLSLPVVAVTTLFAFLGSWNEYIFGLTFISSKGLYTLPMGLYDLQYTAAREAGNWSLFAAGSLVVALPVALLFLGLQKYLTSGLLSGGVKG